MSGVPPKCECPELRTGRPCGLAAVWFVQVGSRQSDGQYCCGKHLHGTCEAMSGAELPRRAALTVTAVTR
jgi:hypothetical protein